MFVTPINTQGSRRKSHCRGSQELTREVCCDLKWEKFIQGVNWCLWHQLTRDFAPIRGEMSLQRSRAQFQITSLLLSTLASQLFELSNKYPKSNRRNDCCVVCVTKKSLQGTLRLNSWFCWDSRRKKLIAGVNWCSWHQLTHRVRGEKVIAGEAEALLVRFEVKKSLQGKPRLSSWLSCDLKRKRLFEGLIDVRDTN